MQVLEKNEKEKWIVLCPLSKKLQNPTQYLLLICLYIHNLGIEKPCKNTWVFFPDYKKCF